MMLFGLFIEDIQMYTIRHSEFDISEFLEKVINLYETDTLLKDKQENIKKRSLRSYLRGRSLWCYTTSSEAIFVPNESN